MSCTNRKYQKSAQAAYNIASQPYVVVGTQVTILGTQTVDTGCSITTQAGGFRVNCGGLFRVSYDVTSTPTAAGTQSLQLYRDGVAIPGAVTTDTVTDAGTITQHVEQIIQINTCAAVTPVITARIGGVAGTISNVNASMVKLA